MCLGGLEGELEVASVVTEVVNLATGEVYEGPRLPAPGGDGCAVIDQGMVYWVRAHGGEGLGGTRNVYRARGELGAGYYGVLWAR